MLASPPARLACLAVLPALASVPFVLTIPADAAAQSARDRWIVPGVRVGAIYGGSTLRQLRRVYGPRNVVPQQIPAGEGTFEPGAVVLPRSRARLELIWRQQGGGVREVRIRRGPWRTRRGVRLGLSVARVERLNGRPFNTSWQTDGHGCVQGWRGGRLSRFLQVCFASVRRLTQRQSAAVLRYRGLRSRHPLVRRTMRVRRIHVSLRNTRPPRGGGATDGVGGGGRLTAAQGLCRQWRNLRSQRSRLRIRLTFVNRSGAQRAVMWLGFDGQPKTYGNLAPGQRLTVRTFAAHPWMITDGPGNCLEVHLAGRRSRVIVLRPDGRNFGPE